MKSPRRKPKPHGAILLIEDNEDHAWLFASTLGKSLAAKVHTVASIEAGLEALQRLSCRLIVVDAFLHNRSILPRLPLLRRRAPDCPLIVLAGSGNEALAAEAIKRGATEYVVKNREALEQLPLLVKKYCKRIASGGRRA